LWFIYSRRWQNNEPFYHRECLLVLYGLKQAWTWMSNICRRMSLEDL
jgi:hypothetical protein